MENEIAPCREKVDDDQLRAGRFENGAQLAIRVHMLQSHAARIEAVRWTRSAARARDDPITALPRLQQRGSFHASNR